MSRGIGKLQRRILAELERVERVSVRELVETFYGDTLRWAYRQSGSTRYNAVRRAVRGLVDRGLARPWYKPDDPRTYYQLKCTRQLTPTFKS